MRVGVTSANIHSISITFELQLTFELDAQPATEIIPSPFLGERLRISRRYHGKESCRDESQRNKCLFNNHKVTPLFRRSYYHHGNNDLESRSAAAYAVP